jgi:pimeloyl-ACP methyl ester carboxylesterase
VNRSSLRRGLAWVSAALAVAALGLALWKERPPGPTGRWAREAGFTTGFGEVDGLRIRYVRSGTGSGEPALVLIHGLASSVFTWHAVAPGLARDRDVVALDLPGFGGSDPPAEPAFRVHEAAVLGLMDRLRIHRATLIGSSLGGAVSVLVAGSRPERVESLVLIDPAGYNLAPRDRPTLVRLLGGLPGGPLLERLPIRRLAVRTALLQCFHDDTLVTRERVDEYVAPFFRPGAVQALRAQLASHPGPEDFSERVRRVRAPTLIVWGRNDAWIGVDQAAWFVRDLERSRLVVLEDCGHLPQEERPSDVLRLIESHLGSVQTGSRELGRARRPAIDAGSPGS